MTKNNKITKSRTNIADLPRKLLEGDRIELSDDGIETTGTIVKIKSKDTDNDGNITYFCRVRCENGKVTFATVPSGALIK